MALVRAPVVWDVLSMAGLVHPSGPGNPSWQPSWLQTSVLMQPVQLPSGEGSVTEAHPKKLSPSG